jgi:hypothetical protein
MLSFFSKLFVSFVFRFGLCSCQLGREFKFSNNLFTMCSDDTLNIQPQQVYKSIPHAIVTIAKDGGIRGFYSGLCASIVQVVPYAAIQFTTYHGICRFLGNYRKHPIGQLFAGASAGLIGKLAVLPLDVLKKRLQMWGLNEYRVAKHHTQSPKMRFVAKQIAKYEGLRAFYKGASPAVLKAALQAALAFTLYEQVRTGLTRLAPKRKH